MLIKWFCPPNGFQSTLPARGATKSRARNKAVAHHFNPRSPHGERQDYTQVIADMEQISIHAPRTGSDVYADALMAFDIISIHAPRTGSDVRRLRKRRYFSKFQSTLPARGATVAAAAVLLAHIRFQSTLPARGATYGMMLQTGKTYHFNPRSPHGERPTTVHNAVNTSNISIHAPRTGSDGAAQAPQLVKPDFNPRSPHGERHRVLHGYPVVHGISIHAPRTGSDTA